MELPYDPEVVVCPNCGSEYQLHVTHCIDCGTPTQPSSWAVTNPRQEEVEPRAGSLPPESPAVVLRTTTLGWATMLGEFLKDEGIPIRIEATEVSAKGARYCVCVAEGDLHRAREVDNEVILRELGDGADAFVELPSIDQCPACGARVSLDSAECPSCGLVVGGQGSEQGREED